MTLDVLIVEDAEQDAALMVRELRKAGLDPKPHRVASAAALRDALKRKRWDLVLADFELPSFDAFAALEIVRAVDPELPCIVVSGRVGEEVAVQAMRAGAQDFVPKDRLLRLGPVVLRELKDAEGRRAQARDARRVAAQHEMAVLLASGKPIRECLPEILRTILNHLGWELALLWEWQPEERALRCIATWGTAPTLVERSRALALHSGVDLPGEVFKSERARWVRDYALESEAPRAEAARTDGLHTAVATPVLIAGTVCCVLEFFSESMHDEDEGTLGALDTLASQIGQAMGRDRAMEALRESEARKAAVLDASLDAVISIDHRGRILEFNPAAERIFGYSEQEAVGSDIADLIIPSSLRDAHRRGLARCVATGEGPMLGRRVELPAMRKDGSEFPAEIVITRVGSLPEPTFTGFVRDMTQSVALFRALRAAEARQRVLAEVGAALVQSLDHATALPRVAVLLTDELCDWCAIHLLDDAGTLTQAAAAHRQPGKTDLISDLWRSDSPESQLGPARVASTALAHFIAHVTSADIDRLAGNDKQRERLQELGIASYIAVPLIARGATLGTLSLVREPGQRAFGPEDLELATEIARRCATAIDNALLYREAQESLRARDDFLALAAHELSTPLTPLRMRVQELSRLVNERCGNGDTAQQLEDSVRTIDRSSKRLAELVDRLLDVSRVTVGRIELKRERFDVVKLARDLVDSLSDELERAGSTLEWVVPDKPVEVVWDRKRIQVALHNLLSNAMKFGPGQPIELTIEEKPTSDEVYIAVRDHGPGLTREDRGRLFQRFARVAPVRQYGGFGLGLWIVRQIAEEHGGRVDVWSEPGEGAIFGMTLPRE